MNPQNISTSSYDTTRSQINDLREERKKAAQLYKRKNRQHPALKGSRK